MWKQWGYSRAAYSVETDGAYSIFTGAKARSCGLLSRSAGVDCWRWMAQAICRHGVTVIHTAFHTVGQLRTGLKTVMLHSLVRESIETFLYSLKSVFSELKSTLWGGSVVHWPSEDTELPTHRLFPLFTEQSNKVPLLTDKIKNSSSD